MQEMFVILVERIPHSEVKNRTTVVEEISKQS